MDINEEKAILYPWKKPIMDITIGFALTSITLNFLWLQYILPAIGTALIFIGARSLRRENKYFTLVYFLAAAHMVIFAINLIIISTPLISEIQNNIILSLISIVSRLALFLSFSSAIKNVFLKANVSTIQNSLKSVTASDTRNKLLEFDVPVKILNDMSDENISMLQNAIHVNVYTDLLMYESRHNKYFNGFYSVIAFVVLILYYFSY